jgi:hypothetical protein
MLHVAFHGNDPNESRAVKEAIRKFFRIWHKRNNSPGDSGASVAKKANMMHDSI